MKKLSEQDIRRQMAQVLAEQMARQSLRPSSKREEEAEAFAEETPRMVERSRRRLEQDEMHPG